MFTHAAHPEEIKDIEFTVTSLNCASHHSDSGNVSEASPRRRHRFSSLRKTGALSKVMRSRLSRSFYSHCDRKKTEAAAAQASMMRPTQSAHLPDTLPEDQTNGHQTCLLSTTLGTDDPSTSGTDQNVTSHATTEKHKKRTKLCVAL